MPELNRSKLAQLLNSEQQLFYKTHPKSYELYQRARKSLHGGVPMLWMIRWAGSFPVFVKEAKGAHFTDVDGNSYVDLCLGDTGAMTGHSPNATVNAITEQIHRGITLSAQLRRRMAVKPLPRLTTSLTAICISFP